MSLIPPEQRLPDGEPKPLDEKERGQVTAWENLMTLYYVFAMVAILAAYSFAEKFGDSPEGRWMVLGLVIALVGGATYVQFAGRCPRCRTYLGRQTRFALPQNCKICGVPFPRKKTFLDRDKA